MDTPTVHERIARSLRRIARSLDLHSRALLHQHGLTVPQLATLAEVDRLQPVTAGNLANEVQLGSATLTGILDRLEERGLVARSRDTGDRRSVRISLTDEGRRLFLNAPSQLSQVFCQRLSQLAEWEQTNILSTLQRIADMMDVPE